MKVILAGSRTMASAYTLEQAIADSDCLEAR